MFTNSSMTAARVANYKLSSSYPSIKPFMLKDLSCNGFLALDSLTKSWGSSNSAKNNEFLRCADNTYTSDLQPLTWLQKQSIIDILPLDTEEEPRQDSRTPGHDALVDPLLTCPKEDVETQENSSIQDFVRFQAQRTNLSHQRLAFRQQNAFSPDLSHNYSYKINGHSKPNLSYTQLIFMAIETCKDRAMTVNDIYQWCEVNYPYYKHIGPSWKNSLRHNLSINKSFRRMPRDGQMTIGNCELNTNDEIVDDVVSPRENKQGGPGRGAYWVVDDKERKNLLESIYRSQQTMPLSDRNEQRIDQPFSIVVNPPQSGPLLCIDGRFTDASTYLQSRRSDDEAASENRNSLTSPPPIDTGPFKNEKGHDVDYAAMMRGLTECTSSDTADPSVKLSTSCNSQFSKSENPDSDSAKPKLKNRRKSSHEKVRSYYETEVPGKEDVSPVGLRHSRDPKAGSNMTSVNVVVAPHFDHIYARYQQFLPPAIASNMEKNAFDQQSRQQDDGDHDSNPDAEFLRNGFRDDEEEDDLAEEAFKDVIKTEEVELDTPQRQPVPKRSHHYQRPMLSQSKGILASRRRINRAISQRAHKNAKRGRFVTEPDVEIKTEMLDPSEVAVAKGTDDRSDGYNTDSTMPMTSRNVRRSSRALPSVKGKRFPRRKPALVLATTLTADRRFRPRRKRSRPLRIDESHEMAAIRFLANLERRRHRPSPDCGGLYRLCQATPCLSRP